MELWMPKLKIDNDRIITSWVDDQHPWFDRQEDVDFWNNQRHIDTFLGMALKYLELLGIKATTADAVLSSPRSIVIDLAGDPVRGTVCEVDESGVWASAWGIGAWGRVGDTDETK